MKIRVVCIGECLIELSGIDLDQGACRIGFAGDTLNTATYLARLLPTEGFAVSYITNLGTDAFSEKMIARMQDEAIGTTLIGRHPDLLPGIYSIERDAAGERSFRYWRSASAARTLFSGHGPNLGDLAAFDVLYLSGVTLAILPDQVRAALVARLAELRSQGKRIVFDTNYRPRLWPDQEAAREAFDAMWRTTTIGLPSFDDEEVLFPGTTIAKDIARIAALGVPEIILKNGAAGPVIRADGTGTSPEYARAESVVDTSGAGDAFNAGYLAARLQGASAVVSSAAGHRLACRVIAHHGAIIEKADMPI